MADGRGNFGNPEQHRRAGRLGGKAPHSKRGLQAATRETRERVARLGGKS